MVSLWFLLALLATFSSSSAAPNPTPLNIILLTAPSAEVRASCICSTTTSSGSAGDDSCEAGEGGSPSRCCGVQEAVQLALRRLNQNSTLLGGYSLNVTHITASQCSRQNGLDSLHEGLFDSIGPDVAVIGAGCSLATEAVAFQSSYYSLPVVSYESISGNLDDRSLFPYFSRTIPSGNLIAAGVASIVGFYGWKRAAVITEERPEYISMTEGLSDELEGYGVDLIEVVLPENPTTSERSIFPEGVRVFILHTSARLASWILCNATESLDWRQRQHVWLTQGWYQPGWWDGELAAPLGSEVNSSSSSNCSRLQLQEFLYQQRVLGISHYPNQTDTCTVDEEGSLLSPVAAFAYDAVWSVALGLDATAEALPSQCGVNGTALGAFDPLDRDMERRSCVGRLLSNEINSVAFKGASGHVCFENGLRKVKRLRILQYRNGSCLPVESVHLLLSSSDGQHSLEFVEGESNATLWPDGIPVDGTFHRQQENVPLLWLWVVAYVFNSVVILATLVCLLFTIVFRNRKLIKLTSPNLNYLIIAGIVIFTLCTYMFVYPDISMGSLIAFCSTRIWLVSIGTSLCYGTINAKMWRIFYIFYRPQVKKKTIKDWYLAVFVLSLVLLDLIVLIPTTVLDSVRFMPQVVPDVNNPGNFTDNLGTFSFTVTLCDTRWRMLILGVLFGYKAAVQIAGIVLAFMMRDIQIKVLNDSKEMSLALYLSSIILVAVIIISFVFGNDINIYGGSYAFGVPLSCTAVLIVVFFSKMVRLYQDPRGDKIFTSGNNTATSGGGTINMALGTLDNKNEKIMELAERVKDLEKKLKNKSKLESVEEESANGHLDTTDKQVPRTHI